MPRKPPPQQAKMHQCIAAASRMIRYARVAANEDVRLEGWMEDLLMLDVELERLTIESRHHIRRFADPPPIPLPGFPLSTTEPTIPTSPEHPS